MAPGRRVRISFTHVGELGNKITNLLIHQQHPFFICEMHDDLNVPHVNEEESMEQCGWLLPF